MIRVAVDAMGGDRGAHAVIEGALAAASDEIAPVIFGSPDLDTRGLPLVSTTQVVGNVQIANGSAVSLLPNSFNIGPDAQIGGGLTIQNLPPNEPGLVCGATVSGGVTLKNNQSSIQIGQGAGSGQCPGNRIAGGLSCKGNTGVTGGGNIVSGGASGDCAGF